VFIALPIVPSGVWLLRHLSKTLVMMLALAGQLPAVVLSDELPPDALLARPELSWPEALNPPSTKPSEEPVLPAFAPNELLSLDTPSPGLQFSLDPDNEELFFGWQFEF
jgi:hypothetical protein